MKTGGENVPEEFSARRFLLVMFAAVLVADLYCLWAAHSSQYQAGWKLFSGGFGPAVALIYGFLAGPCVAAAGLIWASLEWVILRLTSRQLGDRAIACLIVCFGGPGLVLLFSFALSLEGTLVRGTHARIRSEFDLVELQAWATSIQSKARVATEAEEKALRDRLYWVMEPRNRLVFDDLQIRPDIRRVFGTNVVITVASNSPTEVYTEINGDSVALFIGETGNLMARDPLRMSQLAPGMYLCRYVRP